MTGPSLARPDPCRKCSRPLTDPEKYAASRVRAEQIHLDWVRAAGGAAQCGAVNTETPRGVFLYYTEAASDGDLALGNRVYRYNWNWRISGSRGGSEVR